MIFTGTMHMPFLIPEQKFAVVEHDNEGRGGLINTTFYFDAMLGEFVAALENEPWWKDTLLIITADHRSGRFIGPKSSIPLIFYAPQYLKPQVKKVLSSQVDFVPTIFDLFRWDHPYAGIGRSIFAPGPRLVVQRDGDVMGLIQEKPEAFLQMKAGQLINSTLGPAETAAGQKFILALQQVLMETFAQRRVCPDQD